MFILPLMCCEYKHARLLSMREARWQASSTCMVCVVSINDEECSHPMALVLSRREGNVSGAEMDGKAFGWYGLKLHTLDS